MHQRSNVDLALADSTIENYVESLPVIMNTSLCVLETSSTVGLAIFFIYEVDVDQFIAKINTHPLQCPSGCFKYLSAIIN
jgi:hypothetical protein